MSGMTYRACPPKGLQDAAMEIILVTWERPCTAAKPTIEMARKCSKDPQGMVYNIFSCKHPDHSNGDEAVCGPRDVSLGANG